MVGVPPVLSVTVLIDLVYFSMHECSACMYVLGGSVAHKMVSDPWNWRYPPWEPPLEWMAHGVGAYGCAMEVRGPLCGVPSHQVYKASACGVFWVWFGWMLVLFFTFFSSTLCLSRHASPPPSFPVLQYLFLLLQCPTTE